MGVFLRHFAKAGRQLGSAVNAYNEAVGSLESRVLPQMRRFQELGAASGEEAEDPATGGSRRCALCLPRSWPRSRPAASATGSVRRASRPGEPTRLKRAEKPL